MKDQERRAPMTRAPGCTRFPLVPLNPGLIDISVSGLFHLPFMETLSHPLVEIPRPFPSPHHPAQPAPSLHTLTCTLTPMHTHTRAAIQEIAWHAERDKLIPDTWGGAPVSCSPPPPLSSCRAFRKLRHSPHSPLLPPPSLPVGMHSTNTFAFPPLNTLN